MKIVQREVGSTKGNIMDQEIETVVKQGHESDGENRKSRLWILEVLGTRKKKVRA